MEKKTKIKPAAPIDRTTPRRTMVDVRKAIQKRLAQLGKTPHWLAVTTGMRPATLYDWLNGKTATTSTDKVEAMLAAIGLEIRPKE